MNKRKRNFLKVILSFFTLISWFLLAIPFIHFEEGTFSGAVCTALYSFAEKYLGFATTPRFELYSLCLFTLLLMEWTFNAFVRAKFLTWLVNTLWVGVVYVCTVFYQGNGEKPLTALITFNGRETVFYLLFVVLSTLLLIMLGFEIKTDIKMLGKKKTKKKKAKKISFTHEGAINCLKESNIPEFEHFPNVIIENNDEFLTSVSPDDFEICNPAVEEETELKQDCEPVLEPEIPDKPAEQVVKVSKPFKEEKDTIIDEGSDGDEELESAQEEYKKLKENEKNAKGASIDFISGVGGLRSSINGDYVYDSASLTYKFPSEKLLKHFTKTSVSFANLDDDPDGRTIVDTLAQFKIETNLIGVQHGPTFTLYELSLAPGVKLNTIHTYADNIAMNLAVQSVRILAPIPGKVAIGVEVPNKNRDVIGFDEMLPALKAKTLKIPMILGKTITGDSVIIDLAGAPHLLIAGTTGSGKSVCVNGLICSILYTKTPKEVRMILVDPKMVELTVYNDIPHLLTPVITEAKKAIKAMAFCVQEMERRMTMFSQIGARKIEDYNKKIVEKGLLRAQLPYIMVVIDEFADLMSVVGKELESYIKRITAVARFTGIHLVLATQRPSADVITGIIKSNMPTQIAFAVSNSTNSRIILDSIGAEKLLGRGDMLYASASTRTPQRIQGAYIDSEIEDIVSFVKTQGQPDYIDESFFEDDEEDEQEDCFGTVTQMGGEDMFTRAWRIVADRGEASASYLQRRLSIGYNRAANLIEQLEDAGYVGPARGSKPREILRYPDSRTEMGPVDED